MMEQQNTSAKKNRVMDWVLRFVKGLFIGTGFILPGVSGGALAAVFGIYERIISFLAHITKDFKKNVLFFIPVGLGGVAGVVLLSFALSFFLENYETQVVWFFIGCILGTLPTLWKQAGKKGRKGYHWVIMGVSAVLGYIGLRLLANLSGGAVPLNFGTWMLAGAIIGLGVLVPGLSPSNFLMYMGMYTPMVNAFKNLEILTVLPLGLGGLLCVLAFSRLMDYLLGKIYSGMFHFILGIVFASTAMIIPLDYNYLSGGGAVCLVACLAGVALGLWMGRLEAKYKMEM